MESQPLSIRNIGLKYGVIAAVGFIVLFLVIRAVGFTDPSFHYITYPVLAICIYLALNEVRHAIHKHRLNYLPGLGVGVWVTVVCAVIHALFILIYSNAINPGFVDEVRPDLPFQDYISPAMLGFGAFGETLIIGVVSTFVIMQLFKRNRGPENEALDRAEEKGPVTGANVR